MFLKHLFILSLPLSYQSTVPTEWMNFNACAAAKPVSDEQGNAEYHEVHHLEPRASPVMPLGDGLCRSRKMWTNSLPHSKD